MKLTDGAKLALLDELLCLSLNYISVSSCISFLDTVPCVSVPFRPGCKCSGEKLVRVIIGRDCVYMCVHVHIKT